jgi:hypothetical protein
VLKNKYIQYSSLEDSLEKLAANSIGTANIPYNTDEQSLSASAQQKRIRFFYVMKSLNDNLDAASSIDQMLDYMQVALKRNYSAERSILFYV